MNNDEARQLITSIAQGEKDSLKLFISRIGGRVKAIAFSVLKDSIWVDDVLSFVVVKIWHMADQLKDMERPLGYINTIAYNYSLDIKRQQSKFTSLSETACVLDNLDLKLDVQSVLQCLPEEERQIVLYKAEAGLSFREIGNIMGMSKKMVYNRYHQAKKMFYKYFHNAGNKT